MFFYMFKETEGRVIVSKIDTWEVIPDSIYIVQGTSCNCPSRSRPCKHIDMVQRWLQQPSREHKYLDFDEQFKTIGMMPD
jgi:hypothetical protein